MILYIEVIVIILSTDYTYSFENCYLKLRMIYKNFSFLGKLQWCFLRYHLLKLLEFIITSFIILKLRNGYSMACHPFRRFLHEGKEFVIRDSTSFSSLEGDYGNDSLHMNSAFFNVDEKYNREV